MFRLFFSLFSLDFADKVFFPPPYFYGMWVYFLGFSGCSFGSIGSFFSPYFLYLHLLSVLVTFVTILVYLHFCFIRVIFPRIILSFFDVLLFFVFFFKATQARSQRYWTGILFFPYYLLILNNFAADYRRQAWQSDFVSHFHLLLYILMCMVYKLLCNFATHMGMQHGIVIYDTYSKVLQCMTHTV
jgi:hypothetical protein